MSSAHKMTTAISRECRTLAEDLATYGKALGLARPEAELVVLRSPDRVVFQAGNVGLSVSWFTSRGSEAIGASVMVAGWEGEISFPGQPVREGRRAKQVSERVFQLVSDDGDTWQWIEPPDGSRCTSHTLAQVCVDGMSARLGEAIPASGVASD